MDKYTKALIIEITDCSQCKFAVPDVLYSKVLSSKGEEFHCAKVKVVYPDWQNSTLLRFPVIPYWCPLPDASEDEDYVTVYNIPGMPGGDRQDPMDDCKVTKGDKVDPDSGDEGSLKVKPNCYKCAHRRGIPGDTHSACRHPEVTMDSNPFGALIDVIEGKTSEAAKKLGIRGNPYGIKKGWFFWPANFDPAWLEQCYGFEGGC